MRAAQVRDVEALDAHRQRVEPQRLLEPVERLDALLAAALGLELLLVEREPGVALGEVEDPPLAAALGGADLDRAAAALGEELGEHVERRALDQLALDDDQRRDRQRAGVVLQDELLGDAREPLLGLVVEVEGLAVGEHAVADLEDLRVGVDAVDATATASNEPPPSVGHALALEQRADRLQAVALDRGLLVVALAGREVHALARGRARSA